MTDWYQDAIEQTIAESRAGFSNKADAVKYYQEKYGTGKKGNTLLWKQHLIQDMLAVNEVRPDVDKLEYRRQYKNLSKRFDPQRLNTPETRNNAQYTKLARSSGVLKAPPGGYHVHYEGGIQFSTCEQREFDVDITGDLAKEVAAHPDRIIDIAIMVYMQQEGDDIDGVPGPCDEEGEPEITVTANPDDFVSSTVKRHKSAAKRFFK